MKSSSEPCARAIRKDVKNWLIKSSKCEVRVTFLYGKRALHREHTSELPDGRKYLVRYLPCSQFSTWSRTEPVLSLISHYTRRAAWITIREAILIFIRQSQNPELEAANFTSILIKFTSCT